MSSIEGFILDELASRNIRHKDNKQYIQTYCPFHTYSGKLTHLGIRKDGKFIRCLSCGYRGDWNDYARKKNLKLITADERKKSAFNDLLFELSSALPEDTGPVLLPYSEPLDFPWLRYSTKKEYRGPDLPLTFLNKFKAEKWYDDINGGYRILLPIKMGSELVGWTALWTHLESVRVKALNMQGTWAVDAMFPLNYIKKSRWVVLVEGPYDALRLLYAGIPALSILGTPNWSSHLVTVLQSYNFEKVFILMDGDPPGYKTGEIIYNDIVNKIPVTLVDLPEDYDPGKLKNKEVLLLKKSLKKLNKEKLITIDTF